MYPNGNWESQLYQNSRINIAVMCQSQQKTNESVNVADGIVKFKNLLDFGIATQEEFDAKTK